MTVRDDSHARYLNNAMNAAQYPDYVRANGIHWQTFLRKDQQIQLQCTIYAAPQKTNNTGYIARPVDNNILSQNGVDRSVNEIYATPGILKSSLHDVSN